MRQVLSIGFLPKCKILERTDRMLPSPEAFISWPMPNLERSLASKTHSDKAPAPGALTSS